jgi:PEP-CTERM motif
VNPYGLAFAPIPEPSVLALTSAGLGLVGFSAWRRSRRGLLPHRA